jgi:fission process protein 1
MSNDNNNEEDYDLFKDSFIRYFGYSNELGEAFRPLVRISAVRFSYLIELIYFFADTLHKGHKAYINPKDVGNKTVEAIKASGYTLVWQLFASVAIPAFAINRIVKFTGYLVQRGALKPNTVKYLPTFIGLCVIPILPYVLDPLVDKVMSNAIGAKV